MPKPGDRITIDGTKLGAPRREGKLLEQVGSLIKVRWDDGTESLLTPGAGTVSYGSGSSKSSNGKAKAAKKSAAAKPGSSKKTASPKSPKKTTAKKAAKKR